MTILPKKKTAQQKQPEAEKPTDAANHNYAADSHVHASHEPRDRLNFQSRTSPPAWPLHTSREEKRPAGPGFDVSGDSGPSHSKRRHQTSPHRNVRKARTRASGAIASVPAVSPVVPEPQGAVEPTGQRPEEDPSGYNSGDEYDRTFDDMTEEELCEKEKLFEDKLSKKGYSIKKMGEDGACMFRAVADQIYGDQEMHPSVRQLCMDYMAKNSDYYSQYVTEDFEKYVKRKRSDHIHGNHIEMQAMSEMFNRHIEVYHYSSEPINIFHGSQKTDNEPIRLSYHRNVHYNSIVDPYKGTIGVGLGLPAFKPDLANQGLVSDALRASENLQLEQAMLEDKLRATDWEATNEVIEEQIARESYLEWLRDSEARARRASKPTATATSASSLASDPDASPSGCFSGRHKRSPAPSLDSPRGSRSPLAGTSGTVPGATACGPGEPGFALNETASFLNQLPPSVFGLSDWEDSGILAKVLAESQQEYIDSFKRNNSNNNNGNSGN